MGGKASNHIQQSLPSVKTVRTWQLFLILLPLLFLTATLLRFDHLKMVDLRAAVLRADEAGNDTEIEQTLQSLKEYVFTHTVINVAESNGMQTIIFGTGPFPGKLLALCAVKAAAVIILAGALAIFRLLYDRDRAVIHYFIHGILRVPFFPEAFWDCKRYNPSLLYRWCDMIARGNNNMNC